MTEMPFEVRLALQDLMTDYCYAVDALTRIDDLLDVFTEDAVADFSAIGLPLMNDRGEIKKFFDAVFADMSHHAHYITNFRPVSYDGDQAAMTAYVIGLGRSRDGNSVEVHVCYGFECVRRQGGWRCRHYTITPMLPLPASLDEIHGEH
ncbi:hypothetical protein ACFB49_30860 [Sphingomonas sp. DBB INV C78]